MTGWYLFRVTEEPEAQKIEITENGIIIGRGRDCQGHCNSVYVSRHHVKIFQDDTGQLFLRDNKSANGTQVNGHNVSPDIDVLLKEGQRIEVGNLSDPSHSFIFSVCKEPQRKNISDVFEEDDDVVIIDEICLNPKRGNDDQVETKTNNNNFPKFNINSIKLEPEDCYAQPEIPLPSSSKNDLLSSKTNDLEYSAPSTSRNSNDVTSESKSKTEIYTSTPLKLADPRLPSVSPLLGFSLKPEVREEISENACEPQSSSTDDEDLFPCSQLFDEQSTDVQPRETDEHNDNVDKPKIPFEDIICISDDDDDDEESAADARRWYERLSQSSNSSSPFVIQIKTELPSDLPDEEDNVDCEIEPNHEGEEQLNIPNRREVEAEDAFDSIWSLDDEEDKPKEEQSVSSPTVDVSHTAPIASFQDEKEEELSEAIVLQRRKKSGNYISDDEESVDSADKDSSVSSRAGSSLGPSSLSPLTEELSPRSLPSSSSSSSVFEDKAKKAAFLNKVSVKLRRVEEDPSVKEQYFSGSTKSTLKKTETLEKRVLGRPQVIDAPPMPPRRAHKRGISASEAIKMYADQQEPKAKKVPVEVPHAPQNRAPLVPNNTASIAPYNAALLTSQPTSKHTESHMRHWEMPPKNMDVVQTQERKMKLKALTEKPKTDDSNESGSKTRPVSRPKVKVTKNNRGAFLVDCPELFPKASNANLKRIPKRTVINMDKMDTRTPLMDSSFEVPVPPLSARPTYRSAAVPSTSSAPVGIIRPLQHQQSPSAEDYATGSRQLKSAMAKHMGNKVKKTVKFKNDEELCSYQFIDKIGTKKISGMPGMSDADKMNMNSIVPAPSVSTSWESFLSEVLHIICGWDPLWILEEKELPYLPTSVTTAPVEQLVALPQKGFMDHDEYRFIMLPLLLLELWATLTREYITCSQKSSKPLVVGVDRISGVGKTTNKTSLLNCHMVLSKEDADADLYPRTGSLIILDLIHRNGETGQRSAKPVFAYVLHDVRDRVDCHTQLHKDLYNYCHKPDVRIQLTLRINFIENFQFVLDKALRIKIVKYIAPDLRHFRALNYLSESKLVNHIISPACDEADFTLPEPSGVLVVQNELNPAQQSVVLRTARLCKEKEPKICVIQGPPGTGKSKLIEALVLQILYEDQLYNSHNRTRGLIPKILLCAPSNNAVDLLVRRLLKRRQSITAREDRFRMVRVGRQDCIHPEVLSVTAEQLATNFLNQKKSDAVDPHNIQSELNLYKAKYNAKCSMYKNKEPPKQHLEELKHLKRSIAVLEKRQQELPFSIKEDNHQIKYGEKREAMKNVLSGAEIIATTLPSSMVKSMETTFRPRPDKYNFNVCIVDEATQALEVETLLPLMLGVKTLVLVGDPKQLPATVLSKVAREKGLATSLFSRLQICVPDVVQVLDTQYRMHPEILKWPNQYFYTNLLKSPPELERSLFSRFAPYMVLSLPFKNDEKRESNIQEAAMITELTKVVFDHVYQKGEKYPSVGVITPYQNQRKILKDMFCTKYPEVDKMIEVNTIDGCQGQEKDIIIFSCVRSDGIGFLADGQRLNVALTRARQSLFVCGNFDSLESNTMWRSFLDDAKERNVFLPLTPPITVQNLLACITRKEINLLIL